jgi:hypothetical protein
MKTKQELFNYIESSTGWHIKEKELHISLPLYIKSGYELYSCTLAGFGVLFAKVKEPVSDMRMHYNAIKKIEELVPYKVVLVFEKLGGNSISSLIKKHTPFVIEQNQIYMPFALMQVKTNNKATQLKKHQKLTPNADTVLIGYLSNLIKNKTIIKEIAAITNMELRATSNALAVLESLEYLQICKEGKSKIIDFIPQENVYERLKNEGLSPIKYLFYTTKVPFEDSIILSGYSALSKHSNLMDDAIKTLAVVENKNIKQLLEEIKCEKEDANYKVEIWDRDPSTFSRNGVIHELYILRLLKNEDDERTIYALKDLEQNFKNSFKGEV